MYTKNTASLTLLPNKQTNNSNNNNKRIQKLDQGRDRDLDLLQMLNSLFHQIPLIHHRTHMPMPLIKDLVALITQITRQITETTDNKHHHQLTITPHHQETFQRTLSTKSTLA